MPFLEILRTLEMVPFVAYFTGVEVAIVTEKIARYLNGPNVFRGQIQVKRMCLFWIEAH